MRDEASNETLSDILYRLKTFGSPCTYTITKLNSIISRSVMWYIYIYIFNVYVFVFVCASVYLSSFFLIVNLFFNRITFVTLIFLSLCYLFFYFPLSILSLKGKGTVGPAFLHGGRRQLQLHYTKVKRNIFIYELYYKKRFFFSNRPIVQ